MDFAKMKVADLKKELKNRGLSQVGNKNELQERLQLATLESESVLDPKISELLDEDVLNDDDLDEEDKSLLNLESSHIEDESLLSTSSHSTKAETSTLASSEAEKKIVLKRTSITVAPSSPVEADPEPSAKVPKVAQLTAAERLEIRTKKFGAAAAPPTSDLKKQARAERFGIKAAADTTPASTATPKAATETKPANNKIDTSQLEAVSVEVLKKRAERFGTVSSKLVTVENTERLAKRQERFGVTAPTAKVTVAPGAAAPATTTPSNGSDYAERAKMRLERFKTEVK